MERTKGSTPPPRYRLPELKGGRPTLRSDRPIPFGGAKGQTQSEHLEMYRVFNWNLIFTSFHLTLWVMQRDFKTILFEDTNPETASLNFCIFLSVCEQRRRTTANHSHSGTWQLSVTSLAHERIHSKRPMIFALVRSNMIHSPHKTIQYSIMRNQSKFA